MCIASRPGRLGAGRQPDDRRRSGLDLDPTRERPTVPTVDLRDVHTRSGQQDALVVEAVNNYLPLHDLRIPACEVHRSAQRQRALLLVVAYPLGRALEVAEPNSD